MKLVFAGTPVFADVALRALIAAGHNVELVLTQPDRPAGRGKQLRASPVKQTALALDIPIAQPARLRDPASWEPVQSAGADAMIVAAYGLILPPGLLRVPRRGCLNIHASLLPRWRGAAPIQRAIAAGDTVSGVCIMQMDEGLDTGPVLLRRRCDILATDTGASLHDRLAMLGADAIVAALQGLALGDLQAVAQPADGITYAAKVLPEERWLDWTHPAHRLADQIRAFDPVPGCAARLAREPDQALKIWSAQALPERPSGLGIGEPGLLRFVEGSVLVSCGDTTWLKLQSVQRPGGNRITINDFQRASGAFRDNDRFLVPQA